MSEEQGGDQPQREPSNGTSGDERKPNTSGPTFTESPDPLAGVRKATGKAWQSTAGKTVSLRVYLGSIVAVVVLMVLARCGGS